MKDGVYNSLGRYLFSRMDIHRHSASVVFYRHSAVSKEGNIDLRTEPRKMLIDSVIKDNAEKANYFATKTLRKVQKKVGFPERIR